MGIIFTPTSAHWRFDSKKETFEMGLIGSQPEPVDHLICVSGRCWRGYHGNISDREARRRLINETNGIFLVYDNPNVRGQLLLAVYYEGRVHRVPIRRRPDLKYVLGEEGRAYRSVHRLIKRHRRPFGWYVNVRDGRHFQLNGHVLRPDDMGEKGYW